MNLFFRNKARSTTDELVRLFPDAAVRTRFCRDLGDDVGQDAFDDALTRFLHICREAKSPKIVAKKKWLYGGRPHYFPYPNLLFVSPENPYHDTLKELSHACQFRGRLAKRMGMRPNLFAVAFSALYIWMKTGENFSDAKNRYGYCNYEMIGGVEGDAHIVIEPAVRDYVRGAAGRNTFEQTLRERKERMERYYDETLKIPRFSVSDY